MSRTSVTQCHGGLRLRREGVPFAFRFVLYGKVKYTAFPRKIFALFKKLSTENSFKHLWLYAENACILSSLTVYAKRSTATSGA